MSFRFAAQRTPGGHRADEVASALQKEIRRGNERQALYWATELDLAGYGNYVWKRLRIIASEEVGLAEPAAPALVRTLYDNWKEQLAVDKRSSHGTGSAGIFVVHAVLTLARARKSRLADHAFIVMYEGPREPLEIPDHALDEHTAAGRALGRGSEHFWDEAALLVNEGEVSDPFRAEARAISTGTRP